MNTRLRVFSVTSLSSVLFFLNISGALEPLVTNRVMLSLFLNVFEVLVIAVGTWWVLFFKRKGWSLVSIGLFPAVAISPYILLADTVTSSLFGSLEQLSAALLASVLYWLITYFLILTANVLNGAVLFNIPLGQAGKASQFVFSLVSSYFLIAYLFGSAFPIEARIFGVMFFVFYFSYSSIWTIQLPDQQVITSSVGISIMMGLVTGILSVWPLPSVYASVSAVVFLYILLNVAIEMRQVVNRAVWIEYGLLITLVLIILGTLGEWGINGSIF